MDSFRAKGFLHHPSKVHQGRRQHFCSPSSWPHTQNLAEAGRCAMEGRIFRATKELEAILRLFVWFKRDNRNATIYGSPKKTGSNRTFGRLEFTAGLSHQTRSQTTSIWFLCRFWLLEHSFRPAPQPFAAFPRGSAVAESWMVQMGNGRALVLILWRVAFSMGAEIPPHQKTNGEEKNFKQIPLPFQLNP